MFGRAIAGILFCSSALFGYSVLAHEAIIDAVWKPQIEKLLIQRFPGSTAQELDAARAFTYGGCLLQDMGYYPFGSQLFSDLTHYVRSGDFIVALLQQARSIDEYAFALGALAHYAADNTGHRLATNPAVPILYPKLARKFGRTVTYWDNRSSHLKTEFGFDVVQVAKGRYTSDHYHNLIGFEVPKPVLERAFRDTYGMELKEIFTNFDLALGTYRYSVSTAIPVLTRVAWRLKKDEIMKANPDIRRDKFFYHLSRADYEKDWGQDYRRTSFRVRLLAWIIQVIPKVGPFKTLAFRSPTPEVERIFLESLQETETAYTALLDSVEAGELELPNRNYDIGDITRLGTYQGADATYAKFLDKLAESKFRGLSPALRAHILTYYAGGSVPAYAKNSKAAAKEKAEWDKLTQHLAEIEAAGAAGSP